MNEQEQIQQELLQFQQLKEQVQVLASHAGQMEMQLKEAGRAVEELQAVSDDTPVYKSAAGILIRVKDRKELMKELDEKRETMEVRLKSLKGQEEQLKKKLQEMEEDITRKLQVFQARQGTGPAVM
jgi:prefoldin beta subunit